MTKITNHTIYAIGDIHGRDDLLEDLHRSLYGHHMLNHPHRPALLIYIGDYIDGGPSSKAVIERVQAGLNGFSSICLLGNHEDMLLKCAYSDDRNDWSNWLYNGGEATLSSYGLSTRFGRFEPDELRDALGSKTVEWLHNLRLTHRTPTHLFVHAGILPGVALSEQEREDLLWIRRRFLDSEDDHGFIVVHGHTPVESVDIRKNRINLDTGATSNNCLSAIKLIEQEPPLVFRAESRQQHRTFQ